MTTLEEIKELLNKNKTRFLKELEESKEARSLDSKIKKNSFDRSRENKSERINYWISVKQFLLLLYLCLPGGALLLPLLIKLIPDILPSAFREDL